MINKFIYWLGVYFRNPSFRRVEQELSKSYNLSSKDLKDIQNKKLNDTLKFAYHNSSYYRSILDLHCYDPKIMYDIGFLSQLPILTKDILIEKNEEIHTIKNYKFKKLFFSETSGSTGQALTFYKDERWDSYNRASISRGMKLFGVNVWDKNGYFWGFNHRGFSLIKVKFFDFLMNRFRLFSYSDNLLEKFLNQCGNAKYLAGYSSMIYEVAKLANKKNIQLSNIKFIKGTSEKIYDFYQDEVQRAFGQKIVSEYGSAESGIIAFECPYGNMHVNEECCVLEVIEGRAIVTNLIARSFPTIRYDLGDYVSVEDVECNCGRKSKVISEITGRVGKNIIGKKQNYPSLTLYYVFKNMAVEHSINIAYRCEQHFKGQLVVYYESKLTPKQMVLLESEFSKYFNDDLQVEYHHVTNIRPLNRKLKDFESYL
ncbi:phenylacetate--CoA ligase family protein [Vibrio parahaemolyticus]|nr:phenylacetate--CoA ligase family protein [Vibrio parahaemolyticus]